MKNIVLTEYQKKIINAEICPYCKSETKIVDETFIYGKDYRGRKVFCCINFPKCDSYVGTHDDNLPLGRLANKNLRFLKSEAHKYFDVIWKEKHEERSELYNHLSKHLDLPREFTHIGMFSEKTCNEVIDWSKMILNDLRSLDRDFGIDVKRPHYERA